MGRIWLRGDSVRTRRRMLRGRATGEGDVAGRGFLRSGLTWRRWTRPRAIPARPGRVPRRSQRRRRASISTEASEAVGPRGVTRRGARGDARAPVEPPRRVRRSWIARGFERNRAVRRARAGASGRGALVGMSAESTRFSSPNPRLRCRLRATCGPKFGRNSARQRSQDASLGHGRRRRRSSQGDHRHGRRVHRRTAVGTVENPVD